MKWYEWLLVGGVAKHAARSKRSSDVNIHISVDCPEGGWRDVEDGSSPGDGIYVRDNGADPPRFFNRDGEETDQNGHIL